MAGDAKKTLLPAGTIYNPSAAGFFSEKVTRDAGSKKGLDGTYM